jgi:hypothetical protein
MFSSPVNPMLHGQRSALDQMWDMHRQQLEALRRIEALLQQLLAAQSQTRAPQDAQR